MSRQVGKSSGGASEELSRCILYDNFKVLYVSPERDQTKKYSRDRIEPIIKNSTVIGRQIGGLNNVFEKGFKNESRLYLKYAKHNPDSARGVTSDMVHYDEVQDMDYREIAPVIEESLFTSDFKLRLYTGTPKSFENPIERDLWQKSDQREWVIRCDHHDPGKWIKIGIRNIGKEGPICHHCGNLLDVTNGRWVKHSSGDVAGFHVNQLQCRISHNTQEAWDDILKKFEEYPTGKFLNEVLGESADTSDKPLTEAILRNCCDPELGINESPDSHMMGKRRFAGVDWGHGEANTALAIGQFDPQNPNKFRYIYFKKYEDQKTKPDICIPDIAQKLEKFSVERVHADFGGGFGLNDDLAKKFGYRNTTTNYWSNSASAADKRWSTKDEIPRLTLNKPHQFGKFIQDIRNGKIILPKWEDIDPYYTIDFLNVRKEVEMKEGKGEQISYTLAGNDDLFHAAIYAFVIAKASHDHSSIA